MTYKYGEFTQKQMSETKEKLRKQIYFLLLLVDPKTKENYCDVDVNAAYSNILYKLSGLNSILGEPQELVCIISLLESALIEYNSQDFDFKIYRKLVLDAGAKVLEIKEV